MNQKIVGRIHSIETLGTVDGPGIRYVVFLQGCPMRCAYCHNPDTWDTQGGKSMSVGELLDGYEQVKAYLKNGGITVTGGEPLMQMEFVLALMKEAKLRGIHTCIDTSGILFSKEDLHRRAQFDALLEVTDLFLLDIKQIHREKHKSLTGHDNEASLQFAKYLSEHDKDMWIRYVVVPGYTDAPEDLYELGYFIGGLNHVRALDVLPYHSMGVVKYDSLEIDYPLRELEDMDQEQALEARSHILNGIFQRRSKERDASM